MNSSQFLLRSASVGNRFFFRSSFANGFTFPVGCDPAENALKRDAAMAFSMTSAMIERAELPVQRNSTLNVWLCSIADSVLFPGSAQTLFHIDRARRTNERKLAARQDCGRCT